MTEVKDVLGAKLPQKELFREDSQSQYVKNNLPYFVALMIAFAVFVAVYRPTMFSFLISDDFCQITWMHAALKSPEMLFHTYWTPWVDNLYRIPTTDTTQFIRPFFATLLFLSCKFFGTNGLHLRLVNMTVELLSGIMLGLIAISLAKTSPERSNKQVSTWGLFTTILFILYPLHSTEVNWIADGIDLWVVLLALCSFWCYIQWRTISKRVFLILSIIAAFLALLTKEMAVALPPTIFIYHFLFNDKINGKSSNDDLNLTIKARLYRALIATLPYWIMLVLYFCLRKIILGDFVAGYPEGMGSSFSVSGWISGLYAILVPINRFIDGAYASLSKPWHIVMLIAIVLTTIAGIKRDRKIPYFLVIWFLLALLPAYKVFVGALDLPYGQRIAYLATAPLCMFLTYGLSSFCAGNKFPFLFRFLALGLFALSATILYVDNTAFAQAGHLSNKMVQSFKTYFQNVPGDPLVYVAGLPKIFQGIYIPVGNFLNGMTREPMIDRTHLNSKWLDSDDQYTSVGFLKEAVTNKQRQMNLLYWDADLQSLKPVMFFSHASINTKTEDFKLQQIVSFPAVPGMAQAEIRWLNDGSLELKPRSNKGQYFVLDFDLDGLPCWNIDFLRLTIKFEEPKNPSSPQGTQLFFTNDIAKNYSKEYCANYFVYDCCYAPIKTIDREQELIFPLRSLPAWTMGGKCHSLRMFFPIAGCMQIKQLRMPEAKSLMPIVCLPSLLSDPPDTIRLSKEHDTQYVQFDAHLINGCKQIILESVQNSQFFQFLNFQNLDKIILLQKKSLSSYGQMILRRSEFPVGKAIYRARLRALDKNEKQVGFPSDSFFISVD